MKKILYVFLAGMVIHASLFAQTKMETGTKPTQPQQDKPLPPQPGPDGFIHRPSGLAFRKQTFRDGATPIPGQYVEYHVKVWLANDSVIQDSREEKSITGGEPIRMKIRPPHSITDLSEALMLMHIGETARFRFNSDSFYTSQNKSKRPGFIHKGSSLIYEIELLTILTEAEFQKAERIRVKDNEAIIKEAMRDETIIQEYMKSHKLQGKEMRRGMYMITLKEGKGPKPVKGDSIYINYAGRYTDDTRFDSIQGENETLGFDFGSYKLIPGWELGLESMKEGGKYLLIIPAALAYGVKGVDVPPKNAALIYEMELLKVGKARKGSKGLRE